MKLENLIGKKVLIMGLGKEGLMTAKFLRKRLPALEIGVADLRELESLDDETATFLTEGNFELNLGKNYLDCLNDYQLAIKSPGINPRQPAIEEAKKKGLQFTSPTRIFFANRLGKIVAITGSKGKSTTTSLIYEVLTAGGLKTELVGNIGRGALDYLDQDSEDKVFVFEMSSYQLEDFDGSPEVSVMVSFFPDHLDYHGSLEAYYEAKLQLISHLKPGSQVVYNAGSKEVTEGVNNILGARAEAGEIGLHKFNDGQLSRVEGAAAWLGERKLVDLEEIQLLGKHNLQNMLAAAAVGEIFSIPLETIQKVLRNFKGLEHRLEKVGVFEEIKFYNDAISTTPESTMAGMEAISAQNKIGSMLLGGLDRGYKFDGLAREIIERGVENLIIFPETGNKIAIAVSDEIKKSSAPMPKVVNVSTMEEAVKKAYEFTPKGTVCLLSNASPSYNLFKNFEDKGQQFKYWVKKLGQQPV